MRKLLLLVVVICLLVLAMIPAQAQGGTILDVAAGNDNFSTLVAAIQAADPSVAAALSGAGPLTVFAPTNVAFDRLARFLNIELDALLENEELVTNLIMYHVIPGNLVSGQVAALDNQTVQTLFPQGRIGVTVNEDGSIRLNGVANVVTADIGASNGVVHAIDQVIFPNVLLPDLQGLAGDAFIRVGHFSPDTRSVDLYVNGEVAASRLQFGDLSGWLPLPTGSYEIAVVRTGLPLTAEVDGETVSNALLGPATFELPVDSRVTLAAVGLSNEGTLAPVIIPENRGPIAPTNARVTVLHAIPDAPAVDVLAGGGVLVSGLGFSDFVTADVRANTYDMAVVPAGSSEPVVLDLSGTNLRTNNSYFIAAIGSLDDPQLVMTRTSIDEIGIDETVDSPAVLSVTRSDDSADAGDGSGEETTSGGTLADIGMDNPDFSTLIELAMAADPSVLEAVSGDGPLTIFAPTNEAFDALFEQIGVNKASAIAIGGAELLTPVLMYHTVEGSLTVEDLMGMDGETLTTLLGEEVTVAVVDGDVVLNGTVNITEADVEASNGVLHVVDSVLIPQATIDALAALGINLGG